MDALIISIGTLSANSLWGERAATRTGHATTTLILSGSKKILVDPGLPPQIIAARLHERTGLREKDITDVFLTSFHPDVHRGLEAFDKARWIIAPAEREAVGVQIATALKDLLTRREDQGGVAKDESLLHMLQHDVGLLQRCEPTPDNLAPRVDVFPLPGVSPGLTGLILSGSRYTMVLTGDAVPTADHLSKGMVLPTAVSVDQARESFEEVIEIADLIIPGRDNLLVNPTKRPF